MIGSIVIATLFKLLSIAGMGFGGTALLIFLVVGLFIPVALIIYLLSYRASAYIATFGLTIISLPKFFEGTGELFASGNTIIIGIFSFQVVLVGTVIFLSLFLWKKIHPDYKLFFK